MAKVHTLGFPRVGAQRELKFALESYWSGDSDADALLATARELRATHWEAQAASGVDFVPVNDFSLYDHVLDTSFLVGNIPERFREDGDYSELQQYFRVARGRAPGSPEARAAEMTKWFDTNYHFLVPEIGESTRFALNPTKLLQELDEVSALQRAAKPVIVGPLTYLWLAKGPASLLKLSLLPDLVRVYADLLELLAGRGIEWVQIDEPILALDLPTSWQASFRSTYEVLAQKGCHILLASYFGSLGSNLATALSLPVAGLHIDAVRGEDDMAPVLDALRADQVLSLGIVDGRNVWRSDLPALLDTLEPAHAKLGDRLWLAPSCSLLHLPVDLQRETELDDDIRPWLAFAYQRLDELHVLACALNEGRSSVQDALRASAEAAASRRTSTRVHNAAVQDRVAAIACTDYDRASPYSVRSALQRQALRLPLYPTTTIGSFPQTDAIRRERLAYKRGERTQEAYVASMRAHIQHAVAQQESVGLDVLVHGEAERNDMVEYFGEQLDGYAFTQFGWVQSYGSRCVKPPILFGDVARPAAMTVEWIRYAQSLTSRPLKGMLSGPITMLQWSFVRNDQPRRVTATQLALALRDEVHDLEAAGIRVIQVDEPALREGLPLRRAEWDEYLRWSVDAFRLATSGVRDDTQIHTHMCYAEFNDIIGAIAALDADVITIETSRSAMELLDAFSDFDYPNDIGPGVYDIHSPNVPSVDDILHLLRAAARHLPQERLWVNPDCGLKTRTWEEVQPALANMVRAAQTLRDEAVAAE